MLTIRNIAHMLGLQSDDNAEIASVVTDTRKILPNSLFVALKGTQYDGHHFITEAVGKGAIAVISEQTVPDVTIPQLIVNNSLDALKQLASAYRQEMPCKIIAVTGSNGKTTVKEMIAAMLPQPSLATEGNLNNHIGLPLSVLRLKKEHQYAVFELGANHVGEIAYTASIIKPDVALVNNIAPAHIAEFGSIELVARTKAEIYQNLAENGTAIINADDEYACFWDEFIGNSSRLYYSANLKRDIFATEINYINQCARFNLHLPNETFPVQLAVPGQHSLQNALAAASCVHALGISSDYIKAGLENFTGVPGRMTQLEGKGHSRIIDDTYNANLRSVLAAIDVLAAYPGERILVLGDLRELGQWTEEHHQTIGLMAAEKGIEQVMTYGEHSHHTSNAFGAGALHYLDQNKLACDLLTKLNKNTTVLVKGSRSAKMEKIVHQLVG